jgi:hypothetical protein
MTPRRFLYGNFGSKDDLQRPQEYRRFFTRNETFGVERQQSACKWTFVRGSAKVSKMPDSVIGAERGELEL